MGQAELRAIGAELRRLRVAAGLSEVEVAARAGVPQPTVSRVETGRRVSRPDVVERIIIVLSADPAAAERLVGQAREVYAASVPGRADAGVSFRPAAIAEWEARAREIRDFQSVVIPAPLRTGAYAGAAAMPGRPATIGAPGKSFTFVLAEAVLRTWPGTGEAMPGQFARLSEVATAPNVRLGIVSTRSDGPGVLPLHGFTVYDDQAVAVETFTRTLTLTRPEEVTAYHDAFERLAAAAAYGADAGAQLRRAAAAFRRSWRAVHGGGR